MRSINDDDGAIVIIIVVPDRSMAISIRLGSRLRREQGFRSESGKRQGMRFTTTYQLVDGCLCDAHKMKKGWSIAFDIASGKLKLDLWDHAIIIMDFNRRLPTISLAAIVIMRIDIAIKCDTFSLPCPIPACNMSIAFNINCLSSYFQYSHISNLGRSNNSIECAR